MNRFYCRLADVSTDKIVIKDKQQIHHAKDVLRLKEREKVMLFDEQANEYRAQVFSLDEQELTFTIIEKKQRSQSARPLISVACAIPKKSKIDDIIDKLTQLGVDRIIPLISARVIVKLDRQKADLRQQRWEKIALSASKQSQRNCIPKVDPATDITQLLRSCADFDLKLIPHLETSVIPAKAGIHLRQELKEVLRRHKPKNILVLIGPEGDFTAQEVKDAVNAGFVPVDFGNFVLRVDTAAEYIASILHYEYD